MRAQGGRADRGPPRPGPRPEPRPEPWLDPVGLQPGPKCRRRGVYIPPAPATRLFALLSGPGRG